MRDWLAGFYPHCRLCGIDDMESGRHECASHLRNFQRANFGAHNVCWWCFYRFFKWSENREYVYEGHIRDSLDEQTVLAEFVSYVMRTNPKWLQNPSAHHPLRKLTEIQKRERRERKIQREIKDRKEKRKWLIRFAKWLRTRPKDEHDFHKRSCLHFLDIPPAQVPPHVLHRMMEDSVAEYAEYAEYNDPVKCGFVVSKPPSHVGGPWI